MNITSHFTGKTISYILINQTEILLPAEMLFGFVNDLTADCQ
jgi:hypothetical protein